MLTDNKVANKKLDDNKVNLDKSVGGDKKIGKTD